MAAGAAALSLLDRSAVTGLNDLGRLARECLTEVLHEAGVPWQVSGQGSLFRFVAQTGRLSDYRSSWADSAAASSMNDFTAALLNRGILLDPGGMGCISTVMSHTDIETLQNAVANALADMGTGWHQPVNLRV